MAHLPSTIGELRSQLSTHSDVVTVTISEAISHAIENRGLSNNTLLTGDALEVIRQSIYYTNDPNRGEIDPMMMLLNAPTSGNPTEGALQYIENLQRQLNG